MKYRATKQGWIRRPFGPSGKMKSIEVGVGEEFELPAGAKPGLWMVPVEQPKPAKPAKAEKADKATAPTPPAPAVTAPEPPVLPPAGQDEAL